MKLLIAFFSISSIFLWSCSTKNSTNLASSAVPVTFQKLDSTFVGKQEIIEKDTFQSKVNFSISQIVLGDKTIENKINSDLQNKAKSTIFSFDETPSTANVNQKSLKAVADDFIAEAAASKADGLPPYAYSWEFETTIDTLFLDEKLVTFKLANYNFTGGAHPNSFYDYYVYNLKTGEPIDVSTQILDTTAFKAVLKTVFFEEEKAFAKENEMDFDESFYFLDNGQLPMPALGIGKNGLECVYSPYAVAPYVRGPIFFTIPFDKLKGIWKNP